ncbi:hypothetical protein GAY28_37635 [Azospirillum brasilense]|nr:hypothetical protein [Azospirillum brasilense]
MKVLLHRLAPQRRVMLTLGHGFDEETIYEQIVNSKWCVPYSFYSGALALTPGVKKPTAFHLVAGGLIPPEPYGLVVSG